MVQNYFTDTCHLSEEQNNFAFFFFFLTLKSWNLMLLVGSICFLFFIFLKIIPFVHANQELMVTLFNQISIQVITLFFLFFFSSEHFCQRNIEYLLANLNFFINFIGPYKREISKKYTIKRNTDRLHKLFQNQLKCL